MEELVKNLHTGSNVFTELTPAEQGLISKMKQGYVNLQELANELNISTKTVKYHLTNIFTKFNVRNRYELLFRLLNK